MLSFVAVSHATLDMGSAARHASRTASDTWSQSLSGCPSLTDSEEKRKERASTMVEIVEVCGGTMKKIVARG